MRAAASLAFFRRHLHQCNSGIGPHLQHQPRRYASRPHSDHLARARALVTLSPYRYRPRGSAEEAQARHGGGEAVLDPAEAGTVRCAANHAPLTPISFVERAAAVYGRRPAVVYGERRRTWSEVRGRCVRLAAALVTHFGVARGDVVSEKTDTAHCSRSRCLVMSLASSLELQERSEVRAHARSPSDGRQVKRPSASTLLVGDILHVHRFFSSLAIGLRFNYLNFYALIWGFGLFVEVGELRASPRN